MRIWRSLDLIITLIVAITVGVLGMIDVAGGPILAGATLATLGVLTMSTLTGRTQLQTLIDLTRRLADHPSADRMLTTSTSAVDVDLSGAGDIGIIGVTLNRTVRNHLTDLRRCLERGGRVRIAVIDPDGAVTAEAARRCTAESAEIFSHRLRPTLDLLATLAGAGRLEVRRLAFVPAFGLLTVDGREVHVDIYSHAMGGREPALALRADRDPQWSRHFLNEFDHIWTAGRPANSHPVEIR